jgi:hypothetical protein
LPRGCSLSHDQHPHQIASIGMTSDGATTAKDFVVWVGGYN